MLAPAKKKLIFDWGNNEDSGESEHEKYTKLTKNKIELIFKFQEGFWLKTSLALEWFAWRSSCYNPLTTPKRILHAKWVSNKIKDIRNT